MAEVYRGKPQPGFDLDQYKQAEEKARKAGKGMWSQGEKYISPREWRRMHRYQRWRDMTARNVSLMVFSLVFLGFAAQCVLAAENYCNDPKSWEKWDELVQKYPDDLDVQALHALRIGLCAKVERGDLTVKQATEIFERAREAIVERKRVQPNERKGGI